MVKRKPDEHEKVSFSLELNDIQTHAADAQADGWFMPEFMLDSGRGSDSYKSVKLVFCASSQLSCDEYSNRTVGGKMRLWEDDWPSALVCRG